MKTLAHNAFAILAIVSAANAEMLTFEDLPNPTTEIGTNLRVAAMPRMYDGFSFTSLNSSNDDEDIFDNQEVFNCDEEDFDDEFFDKDDLIDRWEFRLMFIK